MLTNEALLQLIDLAYSTLENVERWPLFLAALSGTLSGTGAVSLQYDLRHQGTVMAYTNLDPERLSEYQEHYNQVDPWTTGPMARRLVKPGAIITDDMLLPRSEFARTEFFDFVRPQGLSRMIHMALAKDAETASGISVYRSERDAPFSEDERRFVGALVPHLARVLRLHAEMRRQRAAAEGAFEGLAALQCAAFILDANARVQAANAPAYSLLEARDGLSLDKQGLRANSAAATTALRNLVRAFAAFEPSALARPNDAAMPLSRSGGRPPLDVWLAPAPGSDSFGSGSQSPRVLMLVTARAVGARPRESLLRQLHGLTAREARVAAVLATGVGPDAVAEECGYTLETARWYTKQLLQKLDCRTRSALVRLLSRPIISAGQ